MPVRHVATSTIRRLSLYLQYLDECEREGQGTVSSRALAERGGATPAQVRKDLSFFGSFGKRGIGYPAAELATRLRDILGLGRRYRVVLIGAGRIGAALANYPGFATRGFEIAAIYDADPAKIGTALDGLVVAPADRLEADLAAYPADIAVIGTPAAAAQDVADRVVKAGVRAVLNFAPVSLVVPPQVAVSNVNMALELEALTFALARGRRNG
ncbi:MAG: redox-sensing transcriptional repressor Rex [Gemmatimonadetes bacterium GWC2_71_10]|nr:MAG: redox-sensing transcriptional repressor Rex [Gemmatimonadetes bacterium GWC2_71_10]